METGACWPPPNWAPKSKVYLTQTPRALASLGPVCFIVADGSLSDKNIPSLLAAHDPEATLPPVLL